MRRSVRTRRHQRLVAVQQAGNAVDRRGLDRLDQFHVGEDGGQAARQQRLARARRTDQQHVVGASDGHFEGALDVLLALHVGQVLGVDRLFLEQGLHVAHRRGQVLAAVEKADCLRQGLHPEHRHAVHHRRLGGVLQGHHHALGPRGLRPDRHRQDAGNRLDAAIQGQLPHHLVARQHPGLDMSRRLQQAQGNRQVERRPRLAQVRRGEVHGDAPHREGKAAVRHGRLDAVAALAHQMIPAQMNGNVHGLPTAVPIADAMMLPRSAHASTAARMKWKPIRGVNETAAPQAKPQAMA